MTEHSAPSAHSTATGATASAEPPVASADFDDREIVAFSRDDGHAVSVIGKMLVGFFFYSLLVMLVVGLLTYWGVGQTPHADDAHHAAELDE